MEGTTSSPAVPPAIDDLEEQAAARVAAAVCGKRVVILGELPEHGEARGFGVKARVVERLVAQCGFSAVLFEAGSYDFFGLERAIAAAPRGPGRAPAAGSADSLELALARAIGGFWWTRELTGWRGWLLHQAMAGRVAIGGLDDQPSATAAYARATVPGLVGAAVPPARSAECQEAVARYLNWRYTEAVPYDSTEKARLADCTRVAADRATAVPTSGERGTPDEVMLGDLASYFAREAGAAGAPDRDLVMAQHLAWWSARLPQDARIVVWTATTHAARARGPDPLLPLRVPPLGARLAEPWGDGLAVIGFTALGGQRSRAGGPIQLLAALPAHSLEARALAAGTAGDVAGWAYLDQAALRSLGPVPSRLFGEVATTDWSAAFDGVLVIRDEAAPAFEPRR
ncbi:MAG TPA: erythromycin esterase family protein [Longimicrobium sp.]|nr:erythromycin esterase family protein [Longimicrobium sp.]